MSDLKVDGVIASTGTNTNLTLQGKGSGKVAIGDGALLFPDADSTAGYFIKTDGSAQLSFAAVGGAWNFLASTSASGAASAAFAGSGQIDSTYDNYMIVFNEVSPASNEVDIDIQVGTGGTPTYQTSAYAWGWARTGELGTANHSGSASDSSIQMASAIGSDAEDACDGVVYLFNLNASSFRKHIQFDTSAANSGSSGELMRRQGSGRWESSTVVTGVRILASSGNLSGEFYLYGLAKS